MSSRYQRGDPVFLGLGSNLGDRGSNLEEAVTRLEQAGVRVKRQSSIYLCEPVDFLRQPWFLNQVLEVLTELDPSEFLRLCNDVEQRMGRTRTVEKGPRCIDIDLLLYKDEVIHTPQLTIPHPRLHLRRFVLLPLSDLAPHFRVPNVDQPVSRLLDECRDHSHVLRLG